MTNINIEIRGAHAKKVSQEGILTTGMVGGTVSFTFDSTWDGLTKTAVFRGGGGTKDVLNIGSIVKIPPEVLWQGSLYVGVEGYNTDGTVVIPTVWVTAGIVHNGANASGDPTTDPTLPVWAQIQAVIGDLANLNTQAKNDLVAAINEALTKGGGAVDPAEITRLVDKYLAENPPAAGPQGPQGETGPAGPQGEQGPSGADGRSAYAYAQDGGYTGTEEEFAAKLAQEIPNIAPVEATADMTQPVGMGADGKLWTALGGGSLQVFSVEVTAEEAVNAINVPISFDLSKVLVFNAVMEMPSLETEFVLAVATKDGRLCWGTAYASTNTGVNVYALKRAGVSYAVSMMAAASHPENARPGDFVRTGYIYSGTDYISFCAHGTAENVIPAGTKITIWGVYSE